MLSFTAKKAPMSAMMLRGTAGGNLIALRGMGQYGSEAGITNPNYVPVWPFTLRVLSANII